MEFCRCWNTSPAPRAWSPEEKDYKSESVIQVHLPGRNKNVQKVFTTESDFEKPEGQKTKNGMR